MRHRAVGVAGFGSAVYRYKRTPLPEEVAGVAPLVAGIA